MTELVVLALVAVVAIWAARSWRRGLEAVLILVVLEGAIRKWLVPAAANYVYFAKDFLLLGVYAGFLRDPARRRLAARLPPPLALALGSTALIALLGVFNPRSPDLLIGVLGFKAYFLYVPLLWVVPAAFREERELAGFVQRYLLYSIPVGLLATAQFFAGPESLLNTYARAGGEAGQGIITFGAVERVRVTGTFSFITGYGSYLQVISLLALTVLSVRRWLIRGSLRVYVALVLTLLGMLMTGSRGPLFVLLLMMPVYWLLGVVREGGVPALGRFLLGVGLVLSVVNAVGSDAVEAFRARAAGSEDVLERVLSPFVNPVRIAPEIGLVGYGTGTAHQMAEAIVTDRMPYSWLEGFQFEDEPSRVMVELGVVGFLAFFAARLALVVFSLRAVFRLARPLPRALALSSLLLFLAQLTGGVVFNVTGGLYYWFFGGLLFTAIRLDRLARQEIGTPAYRPTPVAARTIGVSTGAVSR